MEVRDYAKRFNDELNLGGLRREVTSYTFNSRCLVVYSLYELEDYNKCIVMLSRTIEGLMSDLIANRINNKKLAFLGVELLEQIQQKIPIGNFEKFDRFEMENSIASIKYNLNSK